MRRFPRRLLAPPRRAALVPRGVRRRINRGWVSRRADPGGLRRQRPATGSGGGDHGGDPEERLQRRRLPRADVHHGHGAAPWERGAEARSAAEDRRRVAQAAGVRGERAHQRHRHQPDSHHRAARRRRLPDQRPEGMDLARRAFRPAAAACPDQPARGGREASRRHVGLPRRSSPGGGQRAHDQADPGDDQPPHDRALLRRPAHSRRHPDRRGGQGLSLHPRRDERRADPDRRRVYRRRPLVHRQGRRLRLRAGGLRPADRPEPGHPVPHRPRLCGDGSGEPDGRTGGRSVRCRSTLRRGGEHGEAARCRRLLAGGGHVPADPRRLRLRHRVRRRAQVPRDPALPDRADLDQPDPRLPRRARPRPASVSLSSAPYGASGRGSGEGWSCATAPGGCCRGCARGPASPRRAARRRGRSPSRTG